jgi:hypothetical protein
MAQKIAEQVRETFLKRKISPITLQWKQNIVKKITLSWKYDTGTNMDEIADNLQENQSSSKGSDSEFPNNNSDNSKGTIILNSVTDCSDSKGILPK